MAIIQSLISSDKYGVKCPYSMTPKGICVHNTANDGSAENEIAYMKNNNNEVSFHVAIDDIQSIQGIPFNRNTWHAGDGGSGQGNRNYISIEICYSKSGGDRFINAEKRAAFEVASLLKRYGWNIGNVKKHQDFSGKYCPHRTIDNGWQRFLNMIQAELNNLNKPVETKPTTTSTVYRVRKLKDDVITQLGAFSSLENAKNLADKNKGFYVFDKDGKQVHSSKLNIVVTTPVNNRQYLNLHSHVSFWRVYPLNKVAKVGNECGSLAPSKYRGLSYEILENKGDVKIIQTSSFGKVQIYAPRDNDSSITNKAMY